MKEHLYKVVKNKQIRVIIDTDAGAEADDQFAIVHGLLTPKFQVMGIVAEQFGTDTVQESYEEIKRVVEKMGLTDEVPVLIGEAYSIKNQKTSVDRVQRTEDQNIGEFSEEKTADNNKIQPSEGVQLMIQEAMKEDPRPLFVLNMGALTNLATAIKRQPEIAGRIVAIWIGGGSYPMGHMDFNLANDLEAANEVFESEVELWQIPLGSYTKMAVSFYELFDKVQPCGDIGGYLIEKMMEVNEKECSEIMDNLSFFGPMTQGEKSVFIRTGEGWSLGDSPAVGVLVTPQAQYVEKRKAQRFNADGHYGDFIGNHRQIRVYHNLDSRIILEDFYAKLKYHYGSNERGML